MPNSVLNLVDDPHLAKLVVFCLGTLERMKELGLVEGGCFGLGEEGRKIFQELTEAGFSPSKEEIRKAMDLLTSPAALEAAQAMLAEDRAKDQA